jgi:hypothetical protein
MIRKSGYRFCDKIMLTQKASELAKRLKQIILSMGARSPQQRP